MNNVSINIDKIFNETIYDFILTQFNDLLKFFANTIAQLIIIRNKIIDVIVFAQMNVKFYYDRKYYSTIFVVKN